MMARIDLDTIPKDLLALMRKQVSLCDWREGEPTRLFTADGFPCVQYESGNWWHYDVERGTWF